MYCSECAFFHGDGLCRSPNTKKRDVGYFQKACSGFEPKNAEPEQKPTEMEKKEEQIVKTCKRCGRVLPLEKFGRSARSKDGRLDTCHECRSAAVKRGFKPKPHQAPSTANMGLMVYEATDERLIEELKSRGYKGSLTKTIQFEL